MTAREMCRSVVEAVFGVGEMTVDRWMAEGRNEAGYRVLFDGEDVTDDATWFDDRRGILRRLKRNDNGDPYCEPPHCGHAYRAYGCECAKWDDSPATEDLYGGVRVVRK